VLAGITAEGRVTQARVIQGLGSGLDEEAVEALKSWRLKPATDVDGRPVPVYMPFELIFRLN
jgi:TonB family protein